MDQDTPSDYERFHVELHDILREANRFDHLITGHPNTVAELTETSERIIAEHEAAKAPAPEAAATKDESHKLWKAAKAIGSGVMWICISFGQTMRPPEPIDYRHYDRSNPDL